VRGGQSFGGGAVSRRQGAVSEWRLVSGREVRDPRGGGREGGHTALSLRIEWPAWILPGFTRESKYLRSDALSRKERSTSISKRRLPSFLTDLLALSTSCQTRMG